MAAWLCDGHHVFLPVVSDFDVIVDAVVGREQEQGAAHIFEQFRSRRLWLWLGLGLVIRGLCRARGKNSDQRRGANACK